MSGSTMLNLWEDDGTSLSTKNDRNIVIAGTVSGVTTAITGTKNNALTISIPDQGTDDANGVGITIVADDAGSGGAGNHSGGNIKLDLGAKQGTASNGMIDLAIGGTTFGYVAGGGPTSSVPVIIGINADSANAGGVYVGSYSALTTSGANLFQVLNNISAGAGVEPILRIQADGTGWDMFFRDATNDANLDFRIGSSDNDELHIQSMYDTGAQTLDYVQFTTDSANAGADKGAYKFNVDGTPIFTIDDGGIEVVGGINFTTSVVQAPTNTGTLYDFQLETEWTTGTIINADFGGATTQSGDIYGIVLDFNTNVVGVTDLDITGYAVNTPALTQSADNITTYFGYNLSTAGALAQSGAGSINWAGLNLQLPNIEETTGTTTAYGINITGGTITSGTEELIHGEIAQIAASIPSVNILTTLGADVDGVTGIMSTITGYSAGGAIANVSYAFKSTLIGDGDDTDHMYIGYGAGDFTASGGAGYSVAFYGGAGHAYLLAGDSGDLRFGGYTPAIVSEFDNDITAATEFTAFNFGNGGEKTWASGAGPLGTQREFQFIAPTYSGNVAAALTITDSATVYINAAPIQGTNIALTNTYSLWVDAGRSRFDGFVSHGPATSVTIATGVIAVTGTYNTVVVQGGTGGGADDLTSAIGGSEGDILILKTSTSGANDTVTVTNGTGAGAFILAGATNFVMDSVDDRIQFIHNGTEWVEQFRSDNS